MFLQLAQQRRTIYQFKTDQVDKELLRNCLNAAIWAPNHGITEPWRFYIIGKQTQQALTEIYASSRAAKRAVVGTEQYDAIYQKALAKFMAYPQIVLVGQIKTTDLVQSKEDYAACACAIQNFQLAAWEQGMGVQWSTGPLINHPQTYDVLSIAPTEVELIGILYIGYPESVPSQARKPLDEVISSYL